MPPIIKLNMSRRMPANPITTPNVIRIGKKLATMLNSPIRTLPISTIIMKVITTLAMI